MLICNCLFNRCFSDFAQTKRASILDSVCLISDFRKSKFSDPINSVMPSGGEPERKSKEFRRGYFKKRAHLRRHTTTIAPYSGEIADEIALSEDSVFVHDG